MKRLSMESELRMLRGVAFAADRVLELVEEGKEGNEPWFSALQAMSDALNLYAHEAGESVETDGVFEVGPKLYAIEGGGDLLEATPASYESERC